MHAVILLDLLFISIALYTVIHCDVRSAIKKMHKKIYIASLYPVWILNNVRVSFCRSCTICSSLEFMTVYIFDRCTIGFSLADKRSVGFAAKQEAACFFLLFIRAALMRDVIYWSRYPTQGRIFNIFKK